VVREGCSYASYDFNFAHVNFDGSSFGGIGKRQLSAPLNFAIHSAAQQIYWQKGQAIYAVGADGSNEHEVAPLNNAYAYDMVVDHNGGNLYYTEVNASQVRRVGLDGKNDELHPGRDLRRFDRSLHLPLRALRGVR